MAVSSPKAIKAKRWSLEETRAQTHQSQFAGNRRDACSDRVHPEQLFSGNGRSIFCILCLLKSCRLEA